MRVDLLGACVGLGDLSVPGTVGGGSCGWSNISTRLSGGVCSRACLRVFGHDCSRASMTSFSFSALIGASLDLGR